MKPPNQFFNEIEKYPDLKEVCRTDQEFLDLPDPWQGGKKQIKAILLGADPTNDGVKEKPGLIKLHTVFGIGSEYEDAFFGLHNRNLEKIGLKKEQVFVQNLCRNYFTRQTAKNPKWLTIAELWIPFLKDELGAIPKHIPVLASAEVIMMALLGEVPPKAKDLYTLNYPLPLRSEKLGRDVFPFYRHPSYSMGVQAKYREFIMEYLGTPKP
jgi:hypothetical protein